MSMLSSVAAGHGASIVLLAFDTVLLNRTRSPVIGIANWSQLFGSLQMPVAPPFVQVHVFGPMNQLTRLPGDVVAALNAVTLLGARISASSSVTPSALTTPATMLISQRGTLPGATTVSWRNVRAGPMPPVTSHAKGRTALLIVVRPAGPFVN